MSPPHTEAGDVILEVFLLLGRVDAGQVHPVVSAVLLRLVPVSLIEYLIFNILVFQTLLKVTLKKRPM